MKSGAVLLSMLVLTIVAVHAEDGTANAGKQSRYSRVTAERYPNYLGAAAGLVTGSGLAYRRWLGGKVGFQISFLPFYIEEKYPEDSDTYEDRDSGFYNRGTINYGGALLVNLADLRYVRFVGYTGANHMIRIQEGDYYYTREEWDSDLDEYVTTRRHKVVDRSDNTVTGGLGAGAEFYVFRFGFTLMGGLLGSYSMESHTKRLSPSIDCGVFFRF